LNSAGHTQALQVSRQGPSGVASTRRMVAA
jgi:hypothetical protein